VQTSFFGVSPQRTANFRVYHDESGTDREHARFLFQGALFIPEARWQHCLECLSSARGDYHGRIHFVDLRDNTPSQKGRAAWNWISTFFVSLSHYCPYKCMVVDTAAKSQRITAFQQPYHLYNYAAMLAVRSALPWSLSEYDEVGLTIFSEHVDRTTEDNFTSYVPTEIARRSQTRAAGRPKCPSVTQPMEPIQLIPGDPAACNADQVEHCEFIQLVDLLTSAVAQAVNASAQQAIKVDMAHFVAAWIQDTRRPPWLQARDLHRRFSVSCFPSSSGSFYDVPLALVSKKQAFLIPPT
jgi:hypothetical protein